MLPDGRAVLTFQRDAAGGASSGPVVVAVRPHGGTFATPVELPEPLRDPRVTVAGDQAVISATAGVSCGDSGCSGNPRAFSITGARRSPRRTSITRTAPSGPGPCARR